MASKPAGTSGSGKSQISGPDKITVRRQNGKIWSHVRKSWLDETPEEAVRQEYRLIRISRAPLLGIHREDEWLVGDQPFGDGTRTPAEGLRLNLQTTLNRL